MESFWQVVRNKRLTGAATAAILRVRKRNWVNAATLGLLALSMFAEPRYADPRSPWHRQLMYDRRLGLTLVVADAAELPYREVAPRLTAGFAHRPLRGLARIADPGQGILLARRKLFRAASHLISQNRTRSPSSLHGIGIAQTMLNHSREACASLEKAAKEETGEPSAEVAVTRLRNGLLLSDLAAAYYLRGIAEDRIELLLQSIEVAARAVAVDARMAPAAFNRALAIETVHTPEQAIAAWDDYLRLDATSGWAAEARQHERALSLRVRARATNASDAQLSAERLATRIEAELLPAWADAFRNNDRKRTAAVLRELDITTRSLHTCCENTFHLRALAAVRRASRADRRAALRLAIAHQQFRDARNLYAKNDTTAALPLFEASRDAFLAMGDVFAMKPWKYMAASALYLGDADRALLEMRRARASCMAQDCPAAAVAHLQWVQGLAAGRAGDPQASLAYYTDALRGFERGREFENAASVRALIADNLEFLGAGEDAWPLWLAALNWAWKSGTVDRIYLAFSGAADAAERRGHLTSAKMFQDVVVEAARREANTVLLADSLLSRARLLHGSVATEASRDLDDAERLAIQVTDKGRRCRLLANISAAKAANQPPVSAVASLNVALRFFEKSNDHYRLAELYANRAVASDAASRPDLAEADYRRSIRVLESLRSEISEESMRERFFSRGSTVFDRVIRHLWVTGRRGEAFAVAEQSRGREINRGATPPLLTMRDLSAALRSDEALVEYALLEDRLAIWVIRSTGTETLEKPVSTESLGIKVASMHEALDSRAAFEASLAGLADQVYAPIAGLLRDTRRLIVVPNKSLRAVPFSALRDATTGRYLLEERELVVAPSAAAWAAATRRDRALRGTEAPNVLVASFLSGDPARNLPLLRHGYKEVQGLHGLYDRLDTIDGYQATPERVLSAARNASVVHIAAHVVQNEAHPDYSSIVLAQGRNGRDLYARDVAAAALHATRFVFLSGCGNANQSPYNDAPLTLPESFLAAGVPLVIGSLRGVDDQATATFALAVHRNYAASGDAVAALREAQLQCLASPGCEDPRFWSSWIAFGGAARQSLP